MTCCLWCLPVSFNWASPWTVTSWHVEGPQCVCTRNILTILSCLKHQPVFFAGSSAEIQHPGNGGGQLRKLRWSRLLLWLEATKQFTTDFWTVVTCCGVLAAGQLYREPWCGRCGFGWEALYLCCRCQSAGQFFCWNLQVFLMTGQTWSSNLFFKTLQTSITNLSSVGQRRSQRLVNSGQQIICVRLLQLRPRKFRAQIHRKLQFELCYSDASCIIPKKVVPQRLTLCMTLLSHFNHLQIFVETIILLW